MHRGNFAVWSEEERLVVPTTYNPVTCMLRLLNCCADTSGYNGNTSDSTDFAGGSPLQNDL